MNQFRRLIVLCALAAAVVMSAGAQELRYSVATADDYVAPLVNPAAVAVGNARGFAFALEYQHPDGGFAAETDGFSLFFSGETGSYVFERRDDVNIHSAALALPITPNVSLGGGLSLPQFEASRGSYTAGILVRPINQLSVGGTARYFAEGETWDYRAGVGVRPFGSLDPRLENRLTASVDLTISDGELLLPLLGLETELVNGMRGDLRFDLEAETISISLSVAVPYARLGAGSRVASSKLQRGTAFAHVSPSRFRSVDTPMGAKWIDYAPGPSIIEQRTFPSFFPFSLLDRSLPLPELLDQIAQLRDDPSVTGIVFVDHNFQTSYANFKDIAAALNEFRAHGKQVVFYYEQTNTLNYALAASVADAIYLHPQGYLNLVGLASVRLYLADFLDRFGIEFVALPSHDFKTGGDTVARASMSDAEREALESLLDSLYSDLLASIDGGRGERLAAPATVLIDRGPYLVASGALEAGLVDGLIYRDQLPDRLEELRPRSRVAEARFSPQMRIDWSVPPATNIALIHAVGDIRRGESDLGTVVGSETLVRAIRAAREDSSIDGILLRIASPGGSTLASDSIAREVALAAAEKPVVVSIGGTAASGGYYIAAPAHHIVAQPVSVTGSIGVLVVLPNVEGLTEKFNINWETIRRGERADFGIPLRRLTPGERELIEAGVAASYQRFLDVVAEGRGMETDAVHAVAQGRVWSGAQAIERGLVDELGGFAEAIEAIRLRTNPNRAVHLVPISGQQGFLPTELPRRLIRADAYRGLPTEVRLVAEALEAIGAYGDEIILMRMPYDLDLAR